MTSTRQDQCDRYASGMPMHAVLQLGVTASIWQSMLRGKHDEGHEGPGSTKVRQMSSMGAPSMKRGMSGLPARAQAVCAAFSFSREAPSPASTLRTSCKSTGCPSATLHMYETEQFGVFASTMTTSSYTDAGCQYAPQSNERTSQCRRQFDP